MLVCLSLGSQVAVEVRTMMVCPSSGGTELIVSEAKNDSSMVEPDAAILTEIHRDRAHPQIT